ncbi:MAG TPA: G8 domain-containing protein [Lacipirellula sp.]
MSASSPLAEPLDLVETAIVAPSSIVEVQATYAANLSTEQWVQSLYYWQFNLLLPEHVPYLTAGQVASIPNPTYFAAMQPASRAALNATQVRALNVAATHIDLLAPEQVSWLTVSQIQSLHQLDFDELHPNQIPLLTTSQIASIPSSGYLSSWSPEARAALTMPQVQSLNIESITIDNLTPVQIGWLTAAQVRETRFYEFYRLHAHQTPWLTTAQIASIPQAGYFTSWSAPARAALTMPQVQSLNVVEIGIGALTSEQMSWLTPAQVRGVKYYEFALLSPAQVPWLTTGQIASLPSENYLAGWSAAARAALTVSQVQSLDIAKVGIDLLTSQQIGWLTPAQVRTIDIPKFGIGRLPSLQLDWLTPGQIQQVAPSQFNLLHAWQIPSLSLAQIGWLQSGNFAGWSPQARAALTQAQVQAINLDTFEIQYFSSTQISWLSAAQVQKVRFYEFHLLQPAQIPLLTAAQIKSITHNGYLASWSAAARAALTAPQVQLFDMSIFRAAHFTSQQIGWLTPIQIRALRFYDFSLLHSGQIQYLTTGQIASIPQWGYIASWSASARAALSAQQVQSLNIGNYLAIEYLTDQQISWLSNSQVQSLKYYQFYRLKPSQVPLLTTAQLSGIPNGYFLYYLPGEFQTALTRQQILSLPLEKWTEYTQQIIDPPNDYHPAEHMPIGPDGLPTSPHMMAETEHVFALVPLQAATHVTVASGNWSNPAIWRNGAVPSAGAKVVVAAGTSVQFDAVMNTAIHTLRIDGTLSFAVDRNTQLKADTIVVYTTGKLHIGTEANPIRDAFTARILIADTGPINTAWDPYLLSRGLISRGEVRMHGKTVTPYVSLAVDPMAGATQLYLSQTPTNWRAGDRIVITGTNANVNGFHSEERTIRAINGTTVTIDALRFNHDAPEGYGAKVHVANLTRNIVLAAEDSSVIAERPHVMFFQNPNVVVRNVAVEGFGRTDKSVAVTDPQVVNGVLQPGTGANPRARYAIHFHHTGVHPDYAPANVSGSVVIGSPGWGFVNHNSNVNFDDNVAYGVYGASFASENGNEIGAMRRNLSINAEGSREAFEARHEIHDFGINGNGFWLQGPGVELVGNISAGSRGVGFVIYTATRVAMFDAANLDDPSLAAGQTVVPVGSIPIRRFEGNVGYTAPVALQVWRHMFGMTDAEGVIDNFFAWNISGGIDIRYSSHLRIRNTTIVGDLENYTGVGIGTITTHDVIFENVRAEGFHVGIQLPPRRGTVVIGGRFAAVRALYIEKGHDDIRSVVIQSPEFVDLTTAQLRGQLQYDVYMNAEKSFAEKSTGDIEFFTEDVIYYVPSGGAAVRLYYAEQQPSYVPFPRALAMGFVPPEYLDKTNQQLMSEFGVAFNARLISTSAPTNLRIRGFPASLLVDG